MRVLITGGAGFVGEGIASALKAVDPDWHVRIFDIRPPTNPSFEHIVGDIFDVGTLQSALEGADVVYHMVGMKEVGACQKDPYRSFRINVGSLAVVLEAIRNKGVKRIIFPSSVAVYSGADPLPIPESTTPRPMSIYGWHKVMCEDLLRGYQEAYGLECLVFRLFNVYGPGNQNVLTSFLSMAKHDRFIKGYGGMQRRDFVHVEDVVGVLAKAATLARGTDGPVNIASGEGVPIQEVAMMVADIIPGTHVMFEDDARFVPTHFIADITRARELLGFDPPSSRQRLRTTLSEMATQI